MSTGCVIFFFDKHAPTQFVDVHSPLLRIQMLSQVSKSELRDVVPDAYQSHTEDACVTCYFYVGMFMLCFLYPFFRRLVLSVLVFSSWYHICHGSIASLGNVLKVVKLEDLKDAKLQIGPAKRFLKRFRAGGDI